MSTVRSPVALPPTSGPAAPRDWRASLRAAAETVARARMRWVVLACLAIAGLSLLLPSVPSYDPWAWIVWGRETLGLELDTRGDVAWKPLPVVFTTLFAPFGDAAPYLWLATARAAGLLALVLAYRLATRLASPLAGVLAAGGLVLARDWTRYMANGLTEPMLIALLLWAIERHLDGRREQALLLGFAAALIRPEAWLFLGLYCLYLWFREPRRRLLVAAVALAAPALWIVPEWIGSGNPLAGSDRVLAVAGESPVQTSASPLLYSLVTGLDRPPPPVYLGAIAAVALALRRRSKPVLGLAAGALAWMALVLTMTALGYPGLGRFFDASAGIVCVLGGVGAVWAMEVLRPRRRALAAGALAAAAALPFVVLRADRVAEDASNAVERAQLQGELVRAVRRAGGRVVACGSAQQAGIGNCRVVANKAFLTALAWELDTHLTEVYNRSAPPAVVFFTPADFVAGDPPGLKPGASIDQRLDRVKRLTRAGEWTVYSDGSTDRLPPLLGGASGAGL